LTAALTFGQSPVALELETFATGLAGMVDIVHADDERLFVVLQPGVIRIVGPDGTVLPTPFLDIQARVNDAGNEQGLLGLAFDPAYAENGRFYVNYTAGSGSGSTRISRFTVTDDPNIGDPASEEILFTWTQPYTNHNGGDLDFGPDGMLYIALGDGGSGNDPDGNAQDLSDPLGDMMRIDVSGESGYTVPEDNPFVGVSNALPEIWAMGLRNPWRFGFDAQTGDLWIGDVGQNAWEEVDFWPAGDNSGPNFGWRCREANVATPGVSQTGCLTASGYVAPVVAINQNTQGWCSVIGGRVYRGGAFHRLQGLYIYTDYCGGHFYTLRQNDQGTWVRAQVLASGQVGFSVIAENAAGELFVGNNSSGILYRIKDACPMPMPSISADGSLLTSSPALGYAWYLDGNLIEGATEQTYEASESGVYYVIANQGTNCLLQSNSVGVVVTGVQEQQQNAVRTFPVPADGSLRFEGLPVGATAIELRDLTGRLVMNVPVAANASTSTAEVGALPNGTYVYVVRGLSTDTGLRGSVTVVH